ncbi:hypothetical protein SAMN05421538_10445 [Paracoccus isoporae]|uniref:Uncharacterized protein n=1 Tax=Paracoccus isoporae TaxID=591205 RepID=A0A1G7A6V9_9RHOB|nr:hypothetical protein [Paracoccus isoporae]SDE10413.1 hypothetical protein SAMN05421538_10445 [Paracoccus isoporae]
MDASPSHAAHAPETGASRLFAPTALIAATVLGLSGCGPRSTDEMLRGGVPARTNLPDATSLPTEAVRTVSRRDFGWRLIYHPAAAPPDADRRAAVALCRLERRRVAEILPVALRAPLDDPGARMIDIYCA